MLTKIQFLFMPYFVRFDLYTDHRTTARCMARPVQVEGPGHPVPPPPRPTTHTAAQAATGGKHRLLAARSIAPTTRSIALSRCHKGACLMTYRL